MKEFGIRGRLFFEFELKLGTEILVLVNTIMKEFGKNDC
jgi:hypothetical protein